MDKESHCEALFLTSSSPHVFDALLLLLLITRPITFFRITQVIKLRHMGTFMQNESRSTSMRKWRVRAGGAGGEEGSPIFLLTFRVCLVLSDLEG